MPCDGLEAPRGTIRSLEACRHPRSNPAPPRAGLGPGHDEGVQVSFLSPMAGCFASNEEVRVQFPEIALIFAKNQIYDRQWASVMISALAGF